MHNTPSGDTGAHYRGEHSQAIQVSPRRDTLCGHVHLIGTEVGIETQSAVSWTYVLIKALSVM